MKVFHLINTLSAGGAELHLLTLCRLQQRDGIEVVVGCLREHVRDSRSLVPDFEREHIRVVRFPAERRLSARFLPGLLRFVERERPDVLHSHLPRADFAVAVVRRFHPHVVWVSSVHDIYSKSWSGRWTLPLFDILWRRADALIAISGGVRDWLVTERGVPGDAVTVIPYGIEPGRFAGAATNIRADWGLDGRPVIGSMGRLEPRKGHDTLIRAMPSVLAQVPDAYLLIAGHDPWGYGKNLQARIDGLGLRDRVRLVGFQPDVPSFLQALDVFAFASRAEGFGQVLIEVMDAGRPVVASRIAPLTEIVEDRSTGLLVTVDDPQAFADGILFLLTHPDRRRQMGEEGQRRVREQFSAETMAQQTARLYEALLARARAS